VSAWLLVGTLATLTAMIWWFQLRGSGPLSSDLTIPWWALAVGAGAAEAMVIHLHFRSESGSFSLVEVPLVFGLLFGEPTVAVLAMTGGIVLSLVLIRRQPLLKLAFNAANVSLQYSMAFALMPVLLSGADPLSPGGWAVVVAVASMVAALSFAMILVVIAITEGRFDPTRAVGAALFAVVVAAANSVQALIAILVVLSEPWGVVLLLLSGLLLFVAYRAYLSEREQRERVEFLYTSSRVLGAGGEMGSVVASFLAEAASIFRAEMVVLTWLPAPDLATAPARFIQRDGEFEVEIADEVDAAAEAEVAHALAGATVVRPATSAAPVGQWLANQGIAEAMVGPLLTDRGTIGLLVVANRLGDVATFSDTDLRLFSTLVQQVAVSLEKDQLGQALVELREMGEELEQQAKYDSLTGLANRSHFLRRLNDLYLTAGDDHGAVLYIDLDEFKPVNDRYGHSAGDELLKQVATRITAATRRSDVVARLGGDEFAVLLTSGVGKGGGDGGDPGDHDGGVDPEVDAVAQRIVRSLGSSFHIDGNEIRIGASVGLAYRQGASTGDVLLHQADLALYEAKRLGKGKVVTFGGHLRATMARQQALRDDLRQALTRGEFEVHYQPIVDINDLRVVGAEALVRWRHPSGRLVSPEGFLDEAEQSGLISSVDRLVRIEAMDKAVAFRALDNGFFVSVNISGQDLLNPSLLHELESDLAAASAPAEALVFELTESALIDRPETAARQLTAIRSLGPRIALDNYGAGYSSVSALRTLPLEFVKIAKPFVVEMSSGDTDLMAAMVALGQKLGFVVVAEGIEDDHAIAVLRELNCDLGQGYHFAKPMAADDLLELIARGMVGPAVP
jgi:predicted signal transduction protein with EAL and GGDEF domain